MTTPRMVVRKKGIPEDPASQTRYDNRSIPKVRARGYPPSFNPLRTNLINGYTSNPRMKTLKYQRIAAKTWLRLWRASGLNKSLQVPPSRCSFNRSGGSIKLPGCVSACFGVMWRTLVRSTALSILAVCDKSKSALFLNMNTLGWS